LWKQGFPLSPDAVAEPEPDDEGGCEEAGDEEPEEYVFGEYKHWQVVLRFDYHTTQNQRNMLGIKVKKNRFVQPSTVSIYVNNFTKYGAKLLEHGYV
jgi:hypothetical protein